MNYGRVNEPVERHTFADSCCGEPANCCTELPLVGLMSETQGVGQDIVRMAEKISFNLFGRSDIPCCEEKQASPSCHNDALKLHRETLLRAAETLAKVCAMLGV